MDVGFLTVCLQAAHEASTELHKTQEEIEVPEQALQFLRDLLIHHPEEQVREFYLRELAKEDTL